MEPFVSMIASSHAQGRRNNPGCGASGVDPGWPHGTGNTKINVRGYNLVHGNLLAADSYEDYMNYCFPDWASAYTWEQTAERIELLTSWGREALALAQSYVLRDIVPQPPAKATWWAVRAATPERPPGATSTTVWVETETGMALELEGWLQQPCGPERTIVSVALPEHPSQLTQIELESRDGLIDVPTQGLMRQYSSYRRQFAPGLPTIDP